MKIVKDREWYLYCVVRADYPVISNWSLSFVVLVEEAKSCCCKAIFLALSDSQFLLRFCNLLWLIMYWLITEELVLRQANI